MQAIGSKFYVARRNVNGLVTRSGSCARWSLAVEKRSALPVFVVFAGDPLYSPQNAETTHPSRWVVSFFGEMPEEMLDNVEQKDLASQMSTPGAKQDPNTHARAHHGLSERLARKPVGASAGKLGWPQRPMIGPLRQRLRELPECAVGSATGA